VLLEKDLGVLVQGVREGRTTFADTLKYVFMATSANFGNMFSMAGVSLFLPFLPLLPKQILLTNLMTDFPEMTIATDRVDVEMVDHPRHWDIKAIRKFMMTFGLVSSVFDYLTFGALLLIFHATHFFFSSRRRHTRLQGDWSSDVCSSDLCWSPHSIRRWRHATSRPTKTAHLSAFPPSLSAGRCQYGARPQPGRPATLAGSGERSEERRVGKEWRSW